MYKNIAKKIIPATYGKIESSNQKLLEDLEKRIEREDVVDSNLLKKTEERILQKEEYTLERTRQILRKLEKIEKSNVLASVKKELVDLKEQYSYLSQQNSATVIDVEDLLRKSNVELDNINQILEKETQNFFRNGKLIELSCEHKDILNTIKDVVVAIDLKLNQVLSLLKEQEACQTIKTSPENAIQTSDKVIGSPTTAYLYNNDYERKVIRTFYDAYEQPDFQKRFLELVQGLDEFSVAKVVTILQRQQLIRDHFGESQDIFSEDEQKKILEIKRQLSTEVFTVAKDMYCFKNYFLPINHFEPCVFIDKHGIEEIENIDILKEKDIIDVGGYIGDSILVLKPLTNRRIFSFEASKENYKIMQKTLKLNRISNVISENLALAAEPGKRELIMAGPSSAFHTNGVVKVRGNEIVNVDTLDHYLKDKNIDVGLIKVDVEGAEQEFLKGARKTIEHFKPVLLLSIYHNADDFLGIKPIIDSWNLGYKFKIHKPIDYSISRETLLIAEVRL